MTLKIYLIHRLALSIAFIKFSNNSFSMNESYGSRVRSESMDYNKSLDSVAFEIARTISDVYVTPRQSDHKV